MRTNLNKLQDPPQCKDRQKSDSKIQQDCLILKELSQIQKSLFSPNIYLWIDQNIQNAENQLILEQLKTNDINPILCSTIEQAQKQIKKYPKDIFRIISSAAMGELVCKQFYQHNQVIHIYIFCEYKPAGQALQQKWSKIKFHTADVKQFLMKLKEQSRCDNRFSQLPTFMKITAKDNTHDNTLINKSRYNLHGLFLFQNRMQAKLDSLNWLNIFIKKRFLKEYPITYNHQLALKWYTKQTFFYKLVNNFLRSSSNPLQTPYLRLPFDATFKAIKQIYDQGKEKKNMEVYRGGFMNDNQLEYLQKNVGQYIEMFGFMSTSTQIDVAKGFIKNYKGNSLITVLIEDDKRQKKIDYGYVNLADYSVFKNEAQVLFNALNVFKVVSYKKQDGIHHITLKYGQLARIVKLDQTKLTQKQKNIVLNYKHQEGIIMKFINQGDVFTFCQMYESGVQYAKKYANHIKNQQTIINAAEFDKMGTVYFKKSEYKNALDYYKKALDINTKNLGENHITTADNLNNIAMVYLQQGKFNKSLEYFEKAFKIRGNILGQNHTITIDTIKNIGIIYHKKAEYSKALQNYEKALKLKRKILGENHTDIADLIESIGTIHSQRAEYDKALQCYEKSLKINLKIVGQNHSVTADTFQNIGSVYKHKGQTKKALQYYEKALSIKMNIFGENHNSTADTISSIGIIYQDKADYNKALSFYERALKISSHILGENHINTAEIMHNIGAIYAIKNDFNKALENYQRVLKIKINFLGEYHSSTAFTLNNIGAAYQQKKQYKKALQYFERALKIQLSICGQNHNSTGDTIFNIGLIYQHRKEFKKALEYYQRSLKIYINTLGEYHEITAETLRCIGILYCQQSKFDLALPYFRRCYDIRLKIFGPDDRLTKQVLNSIVSINSSKK